MPTCGKKPLALPTTSFLVSHSCPGAYNPRSSTLLLSPFVRNLTVPFVLQIIKTILIFTNAISSYRLIQANKNEFCKKAATRQIDIAILFFHSNLFKIPKIQFIFNATYFSWSLITLCTIGISLPSTLKTTISPTRTGSS